MAVLAVRGGRRSVPEGMVRPWPYFTDEDRAAVQSVMTAPNADEQRRIQAEGLARDWSDYIGVRYCIPTNSGTAALHMAVAGVGTRPGDEIICPAFTFWATAAAVLHHNAIPVFVDIEPQTFCMDPYKIEAAISQRTRAIMPVHIHGMPADMDPILDIARRHGLAVIEDAAQAHGASYRGRRVGTLGTCAGFSLQASKNLTTGSEGGLFVTDDEVVHKLAGLLHYFGETVVPGRERETQAYNAYGLGWMYRGDTLGQAVARSQLRRLDATCAARRANCAQLDAGLRDIPGIEPVFCPDDRVPALFSYVVRFCPEQLGLDTPVAEFRRAAQAALRAEGVPTGQWQTRPVPAQEIFQARQGYGGGCPWTCHGSQVRYRAQEYPVSAAFIDAHAYVFGISPPNGPDLMEAYIEAFRKVFGHIDEVVEAGHA